MDKHSAYLISGICVFSAFAVSIPIVCINLPYVAIISGSIFIAFAAVFFLIGINK